MPKTLWKLKPKVKLLTDFFVLDTETGRRTKDGIQWELRAQPDAFIFGVIYGHNFSKIIYTVEDFKNELKDTRYKNKWVFMHNAEYDLGVLYGNIISDLDPNAIFNGKFISATNGVARFADSTNIFGKVGLGEIGKMIGIEKPALGNDHLFSKELGPAEINRCMEDCHILFDALVSMFEFAGDIKITQASLSMTYFRRHHQPHNITHNENTAYFWDSYFGGRTECFKIGPTHAQVIDINSSYPYAMKHCKFPNPGFLKHETGVSVDRLINYFLIHFEGAAKVEVLHPDKTFGFLPLKKDGKLLFPVGRFSGCWNFNELKFAIENGIEILSVKDLVYSEPMPSPFEGYVDSLYKQRFETDNKFEIYRIKIFMNSLYGKFAQRITEESIYIEDVNKAIDLIHEHHRKRTFIKLQMFNERRNDAFLIVKSMMGKTISYAIPSFSSYITSFARIHLLKKLIEMERFRPVYCDTDSIFYELPDMNFKDSKELGGWKVEGKIVTEIQGLKNYKFYKVEKPNQEIHRIKGVPTKAIKTGANTFEYSNLLKTKEGLRRNLDSGVLTKRIKEISGKYTKRIVLDSGETKPITI